MGIKAAPQTTQARQVHGHCSCTAGHATDGHPFWILDMNGVSADHIERNNKWHECMLASMPADQLAQRTKELTAQAHHALTISHPNKEAA